MQIGRYSNRYPNELCLMIIIEHLLHNLHEGNAISWTSVITTHVLQLDTEFKDFETILCISYAGKQ